MKRVILAAAGVAAILASYSASAESPGWRRAKNIADDVIYDGHDRTLYCGCIFTSHEDDNGSGDVSHTDCGYEEPDTHRARADRVEWEHIVPASLMPARQFDCWRMAGRENCERVDPRAQAMIFDLHNLAPSVGQVNALRSNDRYTELAGDTTDFGDCQAQDQSGAFEPPDCLKGDVARVWLYMSFRHGVEISDPERDMFERWSEDDPVSEWERDREQRIFDRTFVSNPWVHGVSPDDDGECSWE